MNSVDQQLNELKDRYQKLTPPPDLESGLRTALNRPSKHGKKASWIAAAVIIFLLFGYSWDALAYYSKKVLGYEQVAAGSVKELMALGRGQQINKSAEFTDGVIVTFDDLIMDGKGFTTLVKCEYPIGYQKEPGDDLQLELKGILRYVRGGGSGEIKGKTVYWVRSFDEEPMLLEKEMKLLAQRTVDGRMETVEIPFVLNRRQAYVPTAVIGKIGKKIKTPYGTICFDRIQASALSTVVSGRITGAGQLSPQSADKNIRLEFSLFNGDVRLPEESSSLNSANDQDFTFSYKFSGLQTVNELKITDISFEEYLPNSKKIKLVPGMNSLELGAKPGITALQEVSSKDGSTIIKIRLAPNVTADTGFFRDDTQLQADVSKEQVKGFTSLEYKVPGQNLTMEIKGVKVNHPVEGTIIIK